MTPVISSSLDFYARHGAALFPIPYGSKAPHGIVESFAHDWSKDPTQWKAWHDTHKCNFGLVAGPSRVIVADIDVSEVGADAAWKHWAEWFQSRGLTVPMPQFHSARGGWHVAFRMPDDLDVAKLRQVPLIGAIEGVSKKSIVDLRIGNGYVVAAGSFYDGTAKGEKSGHYKLCADAAAPHPLPQEIIDHCEVKRRKQAGPGLEDFDYTDLHARCTFLAEADGYLRDEFNWVKSIWALRRAFGDRAWPLVEIISYCDDRNRRESIWEREDLNKENPSTCATLIDESNKAGYREHKRDQMFDGLAQLAAAAVASPPMVPGTHRGRNSDLGAPTQPRYLFETVSDLRSMPDQTWLADRWIPDQSVGIIYGRFASGKSFIAFDLLLHLVYGMKRWHGVELPGIPCYGLLIAREGGTGFKRRVDAFKKHHSITDDTDRIIFMRSPANFGDVAGFAELKTAVEQCGRQFGIVVVDTVGRALPGEDMFDPKSITRFMENLQQLGEISKGVAIGIHHENKSGGVMGSIYFDNNSDFMFHVERDGDPGQGPLRTGTITCVKQKDGEDGWARGVSYKFIETQPNGEGSLVVDSFSAAADATSKVHKPLTSKEGLALTALVSVLKKKGTLGGDIGGRSVTLAEWKEECFRNGSIAPDAAKPLRDLHDRQVGLIDKGRIKVLDDRVRLIGDGAKGEAGNVIPMVPGLPTNSVPLPPGTPIFLIPRGPT
jgi:Bifunctional DNA primase/polymerase, N-terminal/AAA domain